MGTIDTHVPTKKKLLLKDVELLWYKSQLGLETNAFEKKNAKKTNRKAQIRQNSEGYMPLRLVIFKNSRRVPLWRIFTQKSKIYFSLNIALHAYAAFIFMQIVGKISTSGRHIEKKRILGKRMYVLQCKLCIYARQISSPRFLINNSIRLLDMH